MPTAPEVSPEQEALHQEMVKREQAKWNPIYMKGVKLAEEIPSFLKGLTMGDPTQNPDSGGEAFGILAGAALPLGGPTKTGIKGLYSRLGRAVESLPAQLKATSARNQLKRFSHPEEMKWTGVDEMLSGRGMQPVNRDELIKQMEGNGIKLDVKRYGPKKTVAEYAADPTDSGGTHWDGYQLPGKIEGSCREDLIKLGESPVLLAVDPYAPPGSTGRQYDQPVFTDHHYPNDPNTVVATRWNGRRLPGPLPEGYKVSTGSDFTKVGNGPFSWVEGPNGYTSQSGVSPEDAEMLAILQDLGPKGRMIENVQSQWEQKGAHGGYIQPGMSVDERLPHSVLNRQAAAASDALEDKIAVMGQDPSLGLGPEWAAGLSKEEAAVKLGESIRAKIAALPPAEYLEQSQSLLDRLEELNHARVAYDNALDAANRLTNNPVPDMPFKGMSAPPELALKQQLLDIAHNRPDTEWLGIAPSSELNARGEGISPEFQDEMLPRLLEKLLGQAGGRPIPAKNAMWGRMQQTDLGIRPHTGARPFPATSAQLENALNPENVHAPIARLSPELLAAIREKGFPLIMSLLAARQASRANNPSQKP